MTSTRPVRIFRNMIIEDNTYTLSGSYINHLRRYFQAMQHKTSGTYNELSSEIMKL